MKGTLIFLTLVVLCTAMPADLREEADNPAFDFITGFLEGIHETKTIEDLKKCITNIDPIMAKIKQALELFLKMTFNDVVAGIKLLVEAMKELSVMLKPCLEGFTQVQKLLQAIQKADIIKIAWKIITNPSALINDVKKCIEAFKAMELKTAGKAIGDILYRIFLSREFMVDQEDETTFDDIFSVVKGFLSGINQDGKFGNLQECVNDVPAVVTDVIAVVEAFKNIDWTNLDKIIESFVSLVDAVRKVLTTIKPCSKVGTDLQTLIDIILSIDATKLLQKILASSMQVIHFITNGIKAIMSKNYETAGNDLGSVLYLLLIKA